MIFLVVSLLSSLLTIFLWVKDEWKLVGQKKYRILYPIFFAVLSIATIWQYHKLNELSEIKNQALALSQQWPEPNSDKTMYLSDGQLLGIILTGESFLENHRDIFPDTYKDFLKLKGDRTDKFKMDKSLSETYAETNALRDMCDATITMINNIANRPTR